MALGCVSSAKIFVFCIYFAVLWDKSWVRWHSWTIWWKRWRCISRRWLLQLKCSPCSRSLSLIAMVVTGLLLVFYVLLSFKTYPWLFDCQPRRRNQKLSVLCFYFLGLFCDTCKCDLFRYWILCCQSCWESWTRKCMIFVIWPCFYWVKICL